MQRNTIEAGKSPRMKFVLGALTVLVVAAVPALGLSVVGAELFAAGQPAETNAVAEVSNAPFTFDAPTVSLHKAKPEVQTAAEDAMVLKDFQFTASSKLQTTQQIYLQLFQTDPILFVILSRGFVLALQDLQQGGFQNLTPQDRFFLLLALLQLQRNRNPGPTSPHA